MGRYILRRLLWLIPIILGVSLLVCTIMALTPGDPVKLMLGINATEEQVEATRTELGLDRPFFVRYADFIYNAVFKLDLGTSFRTKQSVSTELFARFPYTLKIAFISIGIAILIGIPIGIFAATHQNTFWDNLSMFLSLFCVSMPSFWFALVLVSIFCNKLRILPTMGIDTWQGYILPCASIAIGTVAALARQTRSSMLEVIRQDFITTARAKGQKELRIIYIHALKNALIPIITTIGTHIGYSLGGALIAETIFSIPGIGTYMVKAIGNRDYPAVQGGVLLIAVCFTLVVLLTDLIYVFVDPRLKSQYASNKKRKTGKEKAA